MTTPNAAPDAVGSHVLLDAWDCHMPLAQAPLEAVLVAAAQAAGAKVLGVYFHDFEATAAGTVPGRTGVVLLAESHITVHTWPENGFIAIDIFMCGSCDPDLAADYIVNALQPARHHRTHIARGKGAT